VSDYGLTKYDRPIKGSKRGTIDVYAVIETFGVTCPARQHALKKLLCAGLRGKGSQLNDLNETIVAVNRAIKLQEEREVPEQLIVAPRPPAPVAPISNLFD